MRLRFRTSLKLAPGVRVNIGKRGISGVRFGPRGFGATVGRRKTTLSAGLPGPFSVYQDVPHAAVTPLRIGTLLKIVLVLGVIGGLILIAALFAATPTLAAPIRGTDECTDYVFAHRENSFNVCMMKAIEIRPVTEDDRNLYVAACMGGYGWTAIFDKLNAEQRGSDMSWYDDHQKPLCAKQ